MIYLTPAHREDRNGGHVNTCPSFGAKVRRAAHLFTGENRGETMPETSEFLTRVSTLNRDQLAQLLTVAEALAAGILTDQEREYLQHAPDVGGPEWGRFLADLRGRLGDPGPA